MRRHPSPPPPPPPPPPPKHRDLSKTVQMQIVSMLQGMESDGSLKQGLVTTITEKYP